MTRTIVACFDEDESAARALERAAQLALALSARLVVLSVAPPVEPGPSAEALAPSLTAPPGIGAARLADDPLPVTPGLEPPPAPVDPSREHAERARDLVAGVDAELIDTAEHDAADALVELARERGAELVVVGAHRPSLWQRLVGGAVEQEVARRVRCDLLIVR